MKWISVKDRLPENDDTVLTYTSLGYSFNHFLNITDNGKKKNIWNGCAKVTHWMPLPEPPEN